MNQATLSRILAAIEENELKLKLKGELKENEKISIQKSLDIAYDIGRRDERVTKNPFAGIKLVKVEAA